jgi:hypothetical protein
MTGSIFYEIRVQGHLADCWADWFDNVTIENKLNGEAVLSGAFSDQMALHGLLARVRDLNLALISVTRVESKQPNGGKDEN